MFSLVQSAYEAVFQDGCLRRKKTQLTIMVLGLDKAGKTTAITSLKKEPIEDVTPSVGFTASDVRLRRFHVKFFDLGGGSRIRDIWPRYYAEVHAVVFVVDATSRARMAEAKEVLHKSLGHEYLKGKPVLILANKQDEGEQATMTLLELHDALDLQHLSSLGYSEGDTLLLQPATARMPRRRIDRNMRLGLHWLLSAVVGDKERFKALKSRIDIDSKKQQDIEKEEQRLKAERVKQRRAEREQEELAAKALGQTKTTESLKSHSENTHNASDTHSDSQTNGQDDQPTARSHNQQMDKLELPKRKGALQKTADGVHVFTMPVIEAEDSDSASSKTPDTADKRKKKHKKHRRNQVAPTDSAGEAEAEAEAEAVPEHRKKRHKSRKNQIVPISDDGKSEHHQHHQLEHQPNPFA